MSRKQNRYKILFVGNDENALELIQTRLMKTEYEVLTCRGVEKAIGALEFGTVDIVISEMNLPKISGLDLLRYVKENFSDIEMMITGVSDVDAAIKAIKDGAEEYLVQPYSAEELLSAVNRMVGKMERRRTMRSDTVVEKYHGIIGQTDSIKALFKLIEKAATNTVNVLVTGESGTGKELVARAIHFSSDRSGAPFVSVNCTAITDTLLESELFGHVKGAFTGAKDNRVGFFQIADGGTIFLDEIGDASLNMQGKLLRVLQSKEIQLVGSSQIRKVDIRIIAATHKDLQAMVPKGLFREDLFYRLNIINIPVPALRDRAEDILTLVHFFLNKFAKEMNRPPHVFSDNALKALKAYNWPGNVRELENLIQRLVVITDSDVIHVNDLPPHMRHAVPVSPGEGANRTLADVEKEHITHVLAFVNGNKTRAADILGIDRKTLRKKLEDIKTRS
ncbi:MAG: sigma-54 dependent transcriptional regulator [Pseudomonadota bacterium]